MPRVIWTEDFLTTLPALLDWYERHRRPLPWRTQNPSPYAVWISEVMSQQSTMAMLLPYYERWMKALPSLEALAQASEEEVLKLWTGLGYYSRARNVHKAARALLKKREQNGGGWPRRLAEWLELPGVGPYTAAAVTAICFDEAAVPIDGNVLRVIARFAGIQDPLNNKEDRRALEAGLTRIAQDPRTAGQRSHIAQGLMELGSLVCRPGAQAQCARCPLSEACATAFSSPKVLAERPQPKLRPASSRHLLAVLLYHQPGEAQRYLVRQIPDGRRLGGHWELPTMELDPAREEKSLGDLARHFPLRQTVKHTITTHQYRAVGVDCGVWKGPPPRGHRFESLEHPSVAITTLTRKIAAAKERD